MKKLTPMQRVALRIARWTGALQTRLYASAAVGRLTQGFGTSSNTSADNELSASLAKLRARSRQLMRDSAYARRAREIIVNNVVGVGVGMQAQVLTQDGALAKTVNDAIESEWLRWSRGESCHTGGTLHFCDLERLALREIVTAGEVLIRKHFRKVGDSRVPFALEVIEAERLVDGLNGPYPGIVTGAVRMGVEVDEFQRPVAYYLRRRHPGDRRWGAEKVDEVIRVPAAEIFHLKISDRWPQTRGEPWLATIATKLDDMTEYSRAEVQAARASSYYFATIESPDAANPLVDSDADAAQPTMSIESGLVQQLAPGEKLTFHTPTRPNAALDPFIRAMLREIAAGIGTSYESLSRDYSQSNYSSSRLALLDDRDTWRALQRWWIRSFREPLHREWLQAAVMARAIARVPLDAYMLERDRYEAVLFKPRGWNWVDPTKEVDAYIKAVRAGFITVTDVIAQTAGGLDIEDVLATRRRELDMMGEMQLTFDTDPEEFDQSGKEHQEPAETVAGQGDEEQRLRVINSTR